MAVYDREEDAPQVNLYGRKMKLLEVMRILERETDAEHALTANRIAARLEEKTGMEVYLWDERRTTIEAHQILHAGGKRMKDHRKTVDAVAATLILEGYLTRKRLERK